MTLTKRLSVPVGIAAIIALAVAFGPSLLARAGPSLPPISAEQLLTKMARSDIDGLSGVAYVDSDLGLPELPGGPSGQGNGAGPHGVAPRDLLTGTHTLRVATAGPDRRRVELLGEMAQYTLVRNGHDVWVYDSAENTAVHHKLPAGSGSSGGGAATQHAPSQPPMAPQQLAQRFVDKIRPTTTVGVQGTDTVAGRSAYILSLVPRSQQSLIGRVEMFVDAQTWTPLRVRATPRGGDAPALDAGFREVTFGEPPASRFEFTPPEGARAKGKAFRGHAGDRQGAPPGGRGGSGKPGKQGHGRAEVLGESWTSVLALEGVPAERYGRWLARAGTPASGEFGQGRMTTTRLVTALVTDDGRAYVGAVTPQALEEAAAGQ